MDNRELKKVAISGAAGNIAYGLFNLLGTGDLFGADIAIDLRLLDLPEKKKQLECLVYELQDCSFPLLQKVSVHHNPEQAFEGIDFAILLGGFARKPGMERTELFEMNHSIFEQQGIALNCKAKKTCKVLVVANPANNNCLTLSNYAPDIPKKNFTCLMRLDFNRIKSHTALKAQTKLKAVKNIIVWGNHSSTVFPDLSYAQINGQKASTILSAQWMQKQLITDIKGRGGKILMQKGISSCLSAAQAIRDHIKDWRCGSKDLLSMGVIVEQSIYNGLIPVNLCVSLPVRCSGNYQYEIVKDLVLNDFQKQKILETVKQLTNQRQILFQNQQQ